MRSILDPSVSTDPSRPGEIKGRGPTWGGEEEGEEEGGGGELTGGGLECLISTLE